MAVAGLVAPPDWPVSDRPDRLTRRDEHRRCVLLHTRLENLLRRIQGEYREMPGLRLTPAQAQRLWGLTKHECESLMHILTDTHFLRRTRDGAFVLFDINSPANPVTAGSEKIVAA